MRKKNVLTEGKKARAEQLVHERRLDDAIAVYEGICKTDPMDVDSRSKLAALQFRLGRHAQAEGHALRAIKLAPQSVLAQQTLAAIHQMQGRLDEAASCLEKILVQQPQSAESLVNLARLREQQGQVQNAYALYHRALDLQPESPYVLAKRGELFEKEGRLDEAADVFDKGLKLTPTDPVLNLAVARLGRRQGKHAEALARLESVSGQATTPEVGAEIQILLGQLHDHLGHAERALACMLEGKRRMAQLVDPAGAARPRFLARVEACRGWLDDRLTAREATEGTVAGQSPIFLVGFPRSGTTLLEQVLDSHPHLQTLDEKPMADRMEAAFNEIAAGAASPLADLTEAQIVHLREVYWEEARRHIELRPGALLVDKLPLNIIRVPLIWRVFPEARFILALRHPCDVTLSCLMQNFGVNDAMAGFVSLEGIAQIYAKVMGGWLENAGRLPLHWQQIRYEDLITNFEVETRALLEFLGVGWDDAVLEHTRHAQQRGIINTPSYHQVTQPIYQHARYRWKRYAKEFEPLLPGLQPFIEAFGYGA